MLLTPESSDHVSLVHNVVQTARPHLAAVNGTVANSWKRCVNDYGLSPSARHRPPILTQAELRAHQERLQLLLSGAREEMNTLFQQLADPDLAVVLTDTSGTILHVVSAPKMSDDLSSLAMQAGAIWSEREAGTNGMGTCLVLGEPIAIQLAEHFFPAHIRLTCSAVPVYDENGEIAAVLDVTSGSALLQQHSLVLIGMTARMIENRLIEAAYKNAHPVHFHSRPESLYTVYEGKLMVDGDGTILSANRGALFQLGCATVRELKRHRFDELFQSSLDALLQRSLSSSFHPVPLYRANAANRFFSVAQLPPALNLPARDAVTTQTRGARQQVPFSASANIDGKKPNVHIKDPVLGSQLTMALRVIAHGVPVVLTGETGAGKEVFARALHRQSPHRDGLFVAVNCASLPENLIESELFGYRAGAFTGAQRQGRRGLILQADGGTLFLDEIGDMPLGLQARLLRVLDERKVTPLGTENSENVDLQLISASHRNLSELVRQGRFREDLYYRLSGIEVRLPALRERSDRAELIRAILDDEVGTHITLTDQAQAALMAYSWPGNVRQLHHVLRTAAVLCDGDLVDTCHLPSSIFESPAAHIQARGHPADRPAPDSSARKSDELAPPGGGGAGLNPLDASEREMLLHLLDRHHWNISRVAKALDLSRNTVYRKLHRLRIPLADEDGGNLPVR